MQKKLAVDCKVKLVFVFANELSYYTSTEVLKKFKFQFIVTVLSFCSVLSTLAQHFQCCIKVTNCFQRLLWWQELFGQ